MFVKNLNITSWLINSLTTVGDISFGLIISVGDISFILYTWGNQTALFTFFKLSSSCVAEPVSSGGLSKPAILIRVISSKIALCSYSVKKLSSTATGTLLTNGSGEIQSVTVTAAGAGFFTQNVVGTITTSSGSSGVLTANVDFGYGFSLGFGTLFGAWWASRYSVKKGEDIVRIFLVISVLLFSFKLWVF